MFSFKNKIDPNLKSLLSDNPYRIYRVLIKCKNLQDNIAKKILNHKCDLIRTIPYCNILSARINSKYIERLLEYPEVEYICFDEYAFLCGTSIRTSNKAYFPKDFDKTGLNIGVGIIDSGVYPHPDLTTPRNRINLFVDIINNLPYPYDDNGHGTATCGIIAGNGTSSKGLYKGIATEASICCYKAFDKLGKGYVSDILFSLYSLINSSSEYNIKVLCLPFEVFNVNPVILKSFDLLFDLSISKGITPIVPSGSNKNLDSTISGIALSSKCLTIGGIDFEYSSCGDSKRYNKPDLSSYCEDIVSLNCNNKFISEKDGIRIYPKKLKNSYSTYSGTSLSASYISGLATLLYEKNPSLEFKDISSLLKLATISLDDIPKNRQGSGIVSFNKLFGDNL